MKKFNLAKLGLTICGLGLTIPALTTISGCGEKEADPETRIFTCDNVVPIFEKNWIVTGYKYTFSLGGFHFKEDIDLKNCIVTATFHYKWEESSGLFGIEKDFILNGNVTKDGNSYKVILNINTDFRLLLSGLVIPFSYLPEGEYTFKNLTISNRGKKIELEHNDYKLQVKAQFIDTTSYIPYTLDDSDRTNYPYIQVSEWGEKQFLVSPQLFFCTNMPIDKQETLEDYTLSLATKLSGHDISLECDLYSSLVSAYSYGMIQNNFPNYDDYKDGDVGLLECKITKKSTGETIFENKKGDQVANPYKIMYVNNFVYPFMETGDLD